MRTTLAGLLAGSASCARFGGRPPRVWRGYDADKPVRYGHRDKNRLGESPARIYFDVVEANGTATNWSVGTLAARVVLGADGMERSLPEGGSK